MTRFFSISACILVLLAGIFTTQCRGKKDGQEEGGDLSKAEMILKARTLGLAYLEEGDLESAEAEFLKLVKLVPDEAIGYANLGLVYLRTGELGDAEKNLRKAVELSPEDTFMRLNLATVYRYRNEKEKMVDELEKILKIQPDHVQALYALAEASWDVDDPQMQERREDYLERTVAAAPANIVPRLQLAELLLTLGKPDQALEQLEEVRRIFPEFPAEAGEYLDQASRAIHSSDVEGALTAVRIFHNYLKLTSTYNRGVTELQGHEGRAMGIPTFSFSERAPMMVQSAGSILDAIRFTDVTASAGLDLTGEGTGSLDGEKAAATHVSVGDYNHDGADDIYLGTYLPGSSAYRHFLFKSEMGRFKDVSKEAGIDHKGEESQALFADYDNDGWFDLFIVNEGAPLLYKSMSEGTYGNISRKAFPDRRNDVRMGLFVDTDHEGDLDLFLATRGANTLYLNRGDGTFGDNGEEAGLAADVSDSRDACFGDFDDDGDIDLLVVNPDEGCRLYSNLRSGQFRDETAGSGLEGIRSLQMVTEADFNNDGYLDLFLAGEEPSSFRWCINTGPGSFSLSSTGGDSLELPSSFRAKDAAFFDFDNDGHQDLLICGEPGPGGSRGVLLLHNNGSGSYTDVSHLLPGELEGGRQIALADFNADGDLDIILAGLNGGVRLLRNDGGDANNHLKVRLVGIRTGSGKNNHYGIGAKIELRAGDLYQMQLVTDANVHFGLGSHSDVDVVRIVWTNGTPQNIFTPDIGKELVEEQQLKGSCPFLYTWNGSEFVFVKDIMWRSALGMPMGIMGGEMAYAFADASQDYLRVPGDMLRASGGQYTLQVTDELWETIYFDEARLLAVDHPDSLEVYVDEKFDVPPYPELKIYPVVSKKVPVSAKDGFGNDVLDLVREKDDRYVATFLREDYQGITEMHELVLDPGGISASDGNLHLFLNGWIFPTDASINFALSQGENTRTVAPFLQVMNADGQWETVIPNLGFPEGKNKTVIAGLSDKYLSADRRVKICSNMEIYWDYIFFAGVPEDAVVRTTLMRPVAADHHYRGFSRMYRKGGRYGPHWFDYSEVQQGPIWYDLRGMYTRFGDVKELLQEKDDKYIIVGSGEETTISFDADRAGPLPEGWTRDFLVYTTGWVKDGDMNTATGNFVEPLPFHGMKHYPYGPGEGRRPDPDYGEYMRKYNTREITGETFRRMVYEGSTR